MNPKNLQPTRCALCGTEGGADELYPARLPDGAFQPAVFSARRQPDRIHYRIVRCRACGLWRSDPIAPAEVIAALYAQSGMDYGAERGNLGRTYGRYIQKTLSMGVAPGALLDIGCGDGFILQTARGLGFETVAGVEPSESAVAMAAPDLRVGIRLGEARPGLFPPASFDVICLFQVIDHVRDPRALAGLCHEWLRPGGAVLCLTHDAAALSAKLMGERSPIVDVEHTYLFSPATLSELFTRCGFRIRKSGSAWNTYSLHYLARLLPLPDAAKTAFLRLLTATRMGSWRLTVPLGNQYLIAQKP